MSTPKDNHQSKSFAFESSPEFLLYSDPKLSLITSQYATKATLFQSANSIVYLVNHQETEKPYTLKAIRKMAGVNFDFSTFQQLDHPNLIPLTEHIESEHFHILIKPYVPGIDLHTYVQQNGPLRGGGVKRPNRSAHQCHRLPAHSGEGADFSRPEAIERHRH